MSTAKTLSIRLEAVGGDSVSTELKKVGTEGTSAFNKITQVITPANDNLKVIDNTAKAFNNTLKQAASLVGVYLGFQGLKNTFSGIVNANAEFEKLNASLKTVTGSTSAAESAFAMIENFATTTPYQLDEVVDAFIRLKALGLDPSEEALQSYGNTASAFGKNILDFTSAVAAATVGEFERLKTFGIKASVQGEEVSLTFQGITTTIGKNAAEIEAYLRSIGEVEFAGAMTEQMKTISGITSNIEDNFSKLARNIGSAGLNDAIKEVLTSFNSLLEEGSDVATIIGEGLATAVNLAGDAFVFLAENLDTIAVLFASRLAAPTLTSAFALLKAGVFALNTSLLGTGAAGVSATAGIKMMWTVSKLAATQMYVLTAATNAFKGALTLVGGPAGAVLLAVYALYKLVDSHDVAKKAANDHAETLQSLKDRLTETTKEIEYLNEQTKNQAIADWGYKLKTAEDNVKALKEELKDTGGISFWKRISPNFLLEEYDVFAKDLADILSQSKYNLDEYEKAIWELAADMPEFKPQADAIQEKLLLLKAAEIDARKAREELSYLENPSLRPQTEIKAPSIAQPEAITPEIDTAAYEKNIDDIKQKIFELQDPYDQAMQKADAWKENALANLDDTAEGYESLRSDVERIYDAMVDNAIAIDSVDYIKNIDDIKAKLLELEAPYTQAMASADAWRENALANLDETKEGYDEFKNYVEKIYDAMVEKAEDSSVEAMETWQDGFVAGLQEIYDEASNMSASTQALVTSTFSSMEDSLLEFVTTGSTSFGDLVNSIVSDMMRIAIQYAVIKPLMSGALSYFGFSTAHTGGIIGSDSLSSTMVSPSVFAGAQKYHTGGLVGDEVPIIAQAGEGVFTKGQMEALGERIQNNPGDYFYEASYRAVNLQSQAMLELCKCYNTGDRSELAIDRRAELMSKSELGSKSPVYVNVNVVNNASGTEATASSSTDSNGNLSLDIFVEQIESSMNKNISKGDGLAPLLEQRYGLNPALGSYR